jgi:hypothetical protein
MGNNIDVFMPLFILIAFFLCVRYVHQKMFPNLTRAVEGALRKMVSLLFHSLIKKPMKRFGFAKTVWFWCVLLFVVFIIQALSAFNNGDNGAASSLMVLVLLLGSLIVGGWFLWRCLARRIYTPRALPVRRRFRR